MKEKDIIHVRVNDGLTENEWTDYALTMDAFKYIEPILEECERRETVSSADITDAGTLTREIITAALMAKERERDRDKVKVVYNVRDMPERMSPEVVVAFFERGGFLFVDSKEIKTEVLG